jgi:hypothetical protein
MPEEDYLIDDPPINNQNWACVSLITPETVKGCTSRYIKIRGLYGSKDRAIDRCKELAGIDPTYAVYTVEVGKWIAWSDKKNDDRDLNEELNNLMKIYLEERKLSMKKHEVRKKELTKDASENSDIFSDIQEKNESEENKIDVSKLEKSNYKEIKYLEEDSEISNQKYCCISYIMPEQLEDKTLNNLGIRGFKIRQTFADEDEAYKKCKVFYDIEIHHDTYVGNVGHWLQWSHTPNVETSEYANQELNKLMKAHEENQQKASSFTNNSKNDFINESVENLESSEKFNFLNEIIEDDDDDINLDSIDDQLNNVNSELEEARKKYNEMLKEQSSKK